jgi:shikimate kinase
MKHSGKSSLGRIWAAKHAWEFLDLDVVLEDQAGGGRTSRQIYQAEGKEGFQRYEAEAARSVADRLAKGKAVLAWGGGTVSNPAAVEALRGAGVLVVLTERAEVLYERILRGGRPAFLSEQRPWEDFQALYKERTALYQSVTPWALELEGASLDEAYTALVQLWNTIPGAGKT